MWDLIPFSFALKSWQKLPMTERYPKIAPERAVRESDIPCCPTCRFDAGKRGFVQFHVPVSHQLYGKAVCCPDCWPAPFGRARGFLSKKQQQIADLWGDLL